MTEEQKQIIVRLRNAGIGYRKIAVVLDIPRDKVRNYCKSVNLDGYAKRLVERKDREQMQNECPEISCKQCGKPLKAETAGRKKVYCSEKCRKQWAREHPHYISMSVYSVEKNLKAGTNSRASAAMIAISGTDSGVKKMQKKFSICFFQGRKCRKFPNG